MRQILIHVFIVGVFAISCTSKKEFEITEFNPVSNFESNNDTLLMQMDLSDAIFNGIALPSKNQSPEGYFKINFKIKNNSDSSLVYYYKIFYQNESYKYNEHVEHLSVKTYNEESGNNFYGSWDDAGFHETALIPNDNNEYVITDSFRIVGNPRNEPKYFGAETKNIIFNNDTLIKQIAEIRRIPEWFKQVKENAIKNKITLDEQLLRDGLWAVKEKSQKGNFNNRWKRNPRVGNYSFVLVVATKKAFEELPASITDISKSQDGKFINPYFALFNDSDFNGNKNISVIKSKQVLKTTAKFDLGSGLYIDLLKLDNPFIDSTYYSENYGSSFDIFKRAQFEQYFHNINKNYKMNNIPVAYDVTGNNYSQDDYNANALKYKTTGLISDFVKVSENPGKTTTSDPQSKTLTMKTPGNSSKEFRKENVGVISRIGFTYGKFIAKIKFPEIINKENVWNGLTCAYWLIFQEGKEWNNRTSCDKSGYLNKGDDGPNSPRMNTTFYSEIDFEILKTSKYWPGTSYQKGKEVPTDDPKSNHNIIVTCTNWDLACKEPKHFGIGAKEFSIDDKKYVTHRWDDWYKALTIKHEIDHDKIFNKPFYYEIDWQPERIIWRIGEDKQHMIEVGYMDNTITTIPDNQMVVVFSQEFHDSKWWPLSPFVQDLIPFPKNDIVTEILELEIE